MIHDFASLRQQDFNVSFKMRDNLIGKLKMIDHEKFSDNKKDGNGREFKTSALVSLHSISNIGYSYE
jgi:hypothetical protein